MVELRCAKCNKRLLTYDNTSFKRYQSPVKKCKKCGQLYADPRCHELALEGVPQDIFSVKGYVFLMILGGFLLYRGIHISGMLQIGVTPEMQWFMPAVLILCGICCIIGSIVEIITIVTGRKAKKYDKLLKESERRLSDKSYVYILKDLGYRIPEKYL